jgi:hypothetical protein
MKQRVLRSPGVAYARAGALPVNARGLVTAQDSTTEICSYRPAIDAAFFRSKSAVCI